MKQNTFTIFQGDDKVMNLKAIYEENGDPLSLDDCTEIDIVLPNADGTFSHRLLSDDEVEITSPAVLGKFTSLIPNDISELLNVGALQSVDVVFTIGSETFTVRYYQALTVFQRT